VRNVSASFWSSYPQAMPKTRWRTSASMECWMWACRHSGTHAANAAQMPTAPSASASQGNPPSEVRRPPSKAASRAKAVEVANA